MTGEEMLEQIRHNEYHRRRLEKKIEFVKYMAYLAGWLIFILVVFVISMIITTG